MEHVAVAAPLVGGALMGLAASLLLWTHGKPAGIAGVYGGALERGPDRGFRLSFLVGLLASGVLAYRLFPSAVSGGNGAPMGLVVLAGLLVGFGSRLGSGCTSGHGICGLSRLSRRSMAATAVFMTMGVVTACVVRHWLGVAP
jgi:uncharacterized membrane protein YedE/YeeE